jgi:PAS domain S-box-containing protein
MPNNSDSMSASKDFNSDVLLRALASILTESPSRSIQPQPEASHASQTSPNLQDRYRALVEQIPAVVFMAPLDGGIGEAYVSPEIEKALGYTQEEWLGDPILWYRQIHPDDKTRWSEEAAQMLMTGGALKSTYRVLSRDGRVIWLHCEARTMRTAEGHPWFIHGVGFDITELKQTEQALQKERNFVSAILDTAHVLVIVLDAQGRIVRCNRACELVTGYSFGELKNRYLWEVMVPEDAEKIQSAFRRAWKDHVEQEYAVRWRTRNGQYRTIAWSSTILTQQHDANHMILTGIDITERERLEKRERERQAAKIDETLDLLQRLIDSMSEALFLVDTSGYVIRTNRAAAALLSNSSRETTGRRISDLLLANPEIPCSPEELLARNPQGRLYLEGELRRGAGDSISVSVSCSLVHDRSGTVTGLLLVLHDITERKQAELALSQLGAIVESSDDAIVGKDLNGIITHWNAGAERIFGYSPEEIIGKSVLTLIPPDLHHEEPEILKKIRRGERIEHYESQRVTKDGKRIDVALTISPVKDSSGKLIGASKIARDISGRKLAEEALRRSEKLAAAGRLAASIAHEINNPLAAVTNLLYLMSKHPDKSGRYLELAVQELDRVIHISKQTLGFYRDTSEPVEIKLADLLDNILYIYARRLEGRNIEIKREYDRDAKIVAFSGEIRQVFSNFISNAFDAMHNGGTLTIKISRTRNWKNPKISGVRISVADTGIGIPREHAKHIFEAFYTTKQDVGTGLGLWVTNGIIQKHRGSIRFRSSTSAGKSGTVFSVFLPEKTSQYQAESVQAVASQKLLLR